MDESVNNRRQRAPVYITWSGELVIDAPVSEVWRHVLAYHTWQNYPIREHVSGEPGREGEVVRLKKEEAGVVLPPYFARTLKLEPERRALWKTFRDGDDYFGIVDFRLHPLPDGRTRFTSDVLYEHLVPYESEADLAAFRAERERVVDASMSAIMPKLKALAEREV